MIFVFLATETALCCCPSGIWEWCRVKNRKGCHHDNLNPFVNLKSYTMKNALFQCRGDMFFDMNTQHVFVLSFS